MNVETKILKLAERNNLEVIVRGSSHYQIKSPEITVNYYPLSKKRTAYINGAQQGLSHVSVEKAISLALGKGKTVSKTKAKRKVSYKAEKARLYRKSKKCHWCRCELKLTKDQKGIGRLATLDHRIPLAKGGANRKDNYVLSCEQCNSEKGDKMPYQIIS